jgi:hypothetical protein
MELMSKTFADKRVYTYLDGKGKEIENQSLAEILLYAQRIGAYMQVSKGHMLIVHLSYRNIHDSSLPDACGCAIAARDGPQAR